MCNKPIGYAAKWRHRDSNQYTRREKDRHYYQKKTKSGKGKGCINAEHTESENALYLYCF